MADTPWFKDGLKFQCTQCGDCCTGAPGFVWVNQAEIDALAALREMSVADFETQFVMKVGVRRSLTERPNGDCILFDAKARKCTVYQARPRQCRTWPFWDSNIRTPEAWQECCAVCPGSGKGNVVSVEEILAQSSVIKV